MGVRRPTSRKIRGPSASLGMTQRKDGAREKDDTKNRVNVAQLHLESQHPHLPAAEPAGLLSRKITGEVRNEPGFFASL